MATIKVQVIGDSRQFKSDMQGVVSAAGSAGRGLGTMAKAAGAAGLVLGGGLAIGLKKSLDAAGDFQSKMAVLQATTHGTNAQIAAASKLAIKLGADAKLPAVSAGDAADAMLQLGKAGFSVQKSMAAARGTLLLATAAETDGATAAKVVTQNLNAFGLKAQDTSKIVDEMAGFMNATGTDFAAFADSLTYTAAISHTVGQSFSDTTTQLTILSQAGIEGSQAGTGLRTMLAGLGAEGSKASKVFKSVGVDTVDAGGKFIGMRAVIQQLTPVLDKMTSSQRLTFFQTAFGKTAMNQANIVLGESVAKYDAAKAAIDRKGQADKLAASHMKGYKGALAQLGSALETLEITMGTKFLPVATRVANFLTGIASAPSISVAIHLALVGLKSIAGDAQKAIGDALFGSTRQVVIGGASGHQNTRVVVSQGIISQLENFDWQSLMFGKAKTVVIGGTAGSVVVSGGLISSIRDAFQTAMAKVDWTAVGQTAGAAIGASIVITTAGFDKFAQIAMAWANSHTSQMADIGLTIGLKMFNALLDPTFWAEHWALMASIALNVATLILPEGKIGELGEVLARAAFSKFGKAIEPLVVTVLEKLPTKVGDALATGGGVIARAIENWSIRGAGAAVDVVEGIVKAFARQFGRLGPLVKVLLDSAILNEIGQLVGAAAQKAADVANAIKNKLVGGFNDAKTATSQWLSTTVSWIGALPGRILSALGDLSHILYNAGVAILQGFLDGMKAKFVDVKNFASHIAGEIANLKGPLDYDRVLLVPHGQAIMQGLQRGMESEWPNVQKMVAGIAQKLVSTIVTGIANKTPTMRQQIITSIRSAVTDAKSAAMGAAGDLGSTLGNAISAQATSSIAMINNGPLGQQLAALTAQITANQNSEQLASLNQALTDAQAGTTDADTGVVTVDPAAVKSAQQALDDWSLQQQQTTLQQTITNATTAIQTVQDAKALAAQTDLTNLQDSFNRGLISQADYNTGIQKILTDSGQNYATIGDSLGSSFANAFRDSIKTLAGDVSTILSQNIAIKIGKKVTAASVAVSGAKGGFHGFAAGGIVKGGRGGVLGMIGEGSNDELITPLGRGGLGGTTVNFTINGYVSDEHLEQMRNLLIRTGRRTTGGALGGLA